MRKLLLPFIALMLVQPLNGLGPEDLNRHFIDAAARARKSVVHIVIYNRFFRNGREMFRKVANASGTIITENGYIVTNYHVVSKGNFYRVTTHDGKVFNTRPYRDGKQFLADVKTDIALIQVENQDGYEFVPVAFARGVPLREGEWVLAIGNPYGLSQTITSGIISSIGRNNIGFADIEDFIQSDVSINPGSSGGPLINLKGEMVGLNTAIRSVSGGYQGISFAIPSQIVKHVCYELNRHGRVRRGWIGFIAREGDREAQNLQPEIEIISIVKGSPAERAGLKKGDHIRVIDGKKINSLASLIAYVGKKHVNSKIHLVISRDARLFRYVLTLREKTNFNRLKRGLQLLFTRYGLEVDDAVSSRGITVSYVSPRNMGTGVRKGDLIIGLNGSAVRSIDDFIQKLYKFDGRIKLLEIYRDSQMHEIYFRQQ